MTPYQPFYHPLAKSQIRLLADSVRVLATKEPKSYKAHPTTKKFKKIWESHKVCTQDPTSPDYLCTGALPKSLSHWRRIKKGMPDRYRFFFQFSSVEQKVIYVWFNGPKNIRREGHKSDVYKTFSTLVQRGEISNVFKELLSQSCKLSDS